MKNVLFLQSEVKDPYSIYEQKLKHSPVYFDEENSVVAIYRYEWCREILCSHKAVIPPAHREDGLNEFALLVKSKLARLSNPPHHELARRTVNELFNSRQPVDIAELMEFLVGESEEVEWVSTVAKKLPLLSLLKSFRFAEDDCTFFLRHIETLTKIMLPKGTSEHNHAINSISEEIYRRTESHLATSLLRPGAELLPYYISNLVGLLIQSYDACRGLLSNALLQILNHQPAGIPNNEMKFFTGSVMETLRYDPPVQNTRRVLQEDIMLQNITLKKGQSILLVLAAANRDPSVFEEAGTYDIARTNNASHLTFGAGTHACVASQWVVPMAAQALSWLFHRYSKIGLLVSGISYAPAINVRLPVEIPIRVARQPSSLTD